MADVVSRAAPYQYLRSVNDPDYPTVDWIHNPDLSAVAGFSTIYWTVSGDNVLLLDQAARDAIDAAILRASRDATAATLDQVEDIMRAFALTVLDELNLHAERITAILDGIDAAANLAAVKTAIAAIQKVPQRTVGQLKTALRGKLGS